MLDQRRHWKIIRNQDGTWSWRVSQGKSPERASKRVFTTLEDCIADARSRGYVIRTAKDRRRPVPA